MVDGDTLRLKDGRSVRMIGLNTPETGKKGRADEPFAVAARQRLKALVDASGGRVGLVPGREAKDHYGRTLAHLYGAERRKPRSANARRRPGIPGGVAPNVDLVSLPAGRRKQRPAGTAGAMAAITCAERGATQRFGFCRGHGQVSKVQRNRGGIWIELQGALVLRIAPNLFGQFDSALLEGLQGQTDRGARLGAGSCPAWWPEKWPITLAPAVD